MAAPTTAALARPLVPVGNLFTFALEVLANLFRRPFQAREFFDQAWFVTRVSLLPACAITVPFGAVLALQIGSLFNQLGARSFTGAVAVVGIVQQAAPIATVVIVAGAAGTAVAADLGSRKIREELDALEVMGISVTERLILPRALCTVIVAVLLNGVVMFFTIMTTLLISTVAMNLSPGSYLASVGTLARPSDLVLSLVKAAVFGVICTVVAAHKGMTVTKGPAGVGDAVTDAVVMNFVLLFAANFAISQLMTAATGGGG